MPLQIPGAALAKFTQNSHTVYWYSPTGVEKVVFSLDLLFNGTRKEPLVKSSIMPVPCGPSRLMSSSTNDIR